MATLNYSGKTVWITGASSGLGAALAIKLAAKGANLVLSARRTDLLENVCSQCERSDAHFILPMDVTHTETHQAALEAILTRYRKLDSIVVNAGIGQRSAVLESDLEVERLIMDVNFFGCTSLTRVVLPNFLEQGEGQIVVVSSIMGHVATPRRAMYSASKHALQGYYESLRAELHETGVSISIVCPGYVKTEISLHSLTGSGSPYGDMDAQHANAMSAEVFARKTVRALERQKPVVYVGGPERFAPLLRRISPGLVRFLLPRVITRQ